MAAILWRCVPFLDVEPVDLDTVACNTCAVLQFGSLTFLVSEKSYSAGCTLLSCGMAQSKCSHCRHVWRRWLPAVHWSVTEQASTRHRCDGIVQHLAPSWMWWTDWSDNACPFLQFLPPRKLCLVSSSCCRAAILVKSSIPHQEITYKLN